jgi:N-acetylglucosamine kinase-like BadF-type ATPase
VPTPPRLDDPSHVARYGLGLDAGGTQTRWALARSRAGVVAEGAVEAFSGWQMNLPDGPAALRALLDDVRAGIGRHLPEGARLHAVCAGLTGFDGDEAAPIAAVIAEACGIATAAIVLYNDIELACRAAHEPGAGYLVYAGTGSVAAFIDEAGVQHRAGGRGGLIDDGGSGYWIAREALRAVWRAEDERPGAWRQSLLAQALFEHVGGSDWARTRAYVYGASRGQLGELAVAVGLAAQRGDAQAIEILDRAGAELARLGRVLVSRFGPRPVSLAGRAFALHPVIEATLREQLAGLDVQPLRELQAHRRAAERALEIAA